MKTICFVFQKIIRINKLLTKKSSNAFNMGNNLSKPVFDKKQESLDEFNLQIREIQVHGSLRSTKGRKAIRNMDFCNPCEDYEVLTGRRGTPKLKNPSNDGSIGCSKYWNFLEDEE